MAWCYSFDPTSTVLCHAQEKEYELEHVLQRLAGKDAQIAAAQRAEEVAIVSLSCLPACLHLHCALPSPSAQLVQHCSAPCSHHSMASSTCVDGMLA